MAHRKDRKEALRKERERREQEARAARQRKRLVGYGAGGALAVAAIAVIVVLAAGGGDGGGVQSSGDNFPGGGSVPEQQVFDVQEAADAAGCELTDSRGTGRGHTTDLSQRVNYKDNPPTTGRHYEIPAEDGLYNGDPPTDVELVHALEHGRVIVWAKPNLPEDARKELRALFDQDDYQMLVVRRADMPYAVAATAWNRDPAPNGTGRTLACDRWNEDVIDAIRTFRDEHRSNGPEPIP